MEFYNREVFLANTPSVISVQGLEYLKDRLIYDMFEVKGQLENCEDTYPPGGGFGPNDAFCNQYPVSELCTKYGPNVTKWLFPNPLEFDATEGTYPINFYYKLPHQSRSNDFNTLVTYNLIYQEGGGTGTGQ